MNTPRSDGIRSVGGRSRAVWVISAVLMAALVVAIQARERPSRTEQSGAHGVPVLRADRETIDLGQVPYLQWAEARFVLTNAGTGPLRFSRAPYVEAVVGCCPPVPTIGAMVLDSGQQTTLVLRFMMHEGMGGPHDFRVHLPSNDSAWGDRTLRVLSDWVPVRP